MQAFTSEAFTDRRLRLREDRKKTKERTNKKTKERTNKKTNEMMKEDRLTISWARVS